MSEDQIRQTIVDQEHLNLLSIAYLVSAALSACFSLLVRLRTWLQVGADARSVALIVAAAVVLLVVPLGCEGVDFTLEAWPFPVGTESQALFDAGLVGVWRSIPTAGEEPAELTISSPDGRIYEIAMREGGDDTAFELTGFVVEVGGVRVCPKSPAMSCFGTSSRLQMDWS